MEHIIQFGVTIDDEAIENRIVENAEKSITADIKKNVEASIFDKKGVGYYSGGGTKICLSNVGESIVSDWLKDNSDKIIELAAQMVADKVYRSKAWKAKYGEITE